ncbi:MAG: hypothetical protein HRT47_06395 [Candidatus Caenarcaniphilales bacterium]|nr:hypothetical protein [Candidatus Caenarcaniphilales bacterium]
MIYKFNLALIYLSFLALLLATPSAFAFHRRNVIVRLSGVVDISNIDNNEITFDYIFVIDLD